MAKLLCERPRLQRGLVGGGRRDRRTNPPEDSPRQESMHRKWLPHPKLLNENLAPLRRFLRSRVGLLWDDVYSELREHIRFDSAVQLHILQHLWDFVVRHVEIIDGIPCHASNESWGYKLGKSIDEFRPGGVLYVHPVSGRLCEFRRPRKKKKGKPQPRRRTPPPPVRTLPDGRQLHHNAGVWYAVELAPIRPEYPPDRDVLLGCLAKPFWQHRERLEQLYQRPGVYGVRAEQLSAKELRKLGLSEPEA